MSTADSAVQTVCVEYFFDYAAFQLKFGDKPTAEQDAYMRYLAHTIIPSFLEVKKWVEQGCINMNQCVKNVDTVDGAKGFMLSIGQLTSQIGKFEGEIISKMADPLAPPYAIQAILPLPCEINWGEFQPHGFFYNQGTADEHMAIRNARDALRDAWLMCNHMRKTIFVRCAVDPHLVMQIIHKVVGAIGQMLAFAREKRIVEQAVGGPEVVRTLWGFDGIGAFGVSPDTPPSSGDDSVKRRRTMTEEEEEDAEILQAVEAAEAKLAARAPDSKMDFAAADVDASLGAAVAMTAAVAESMRGVAVEDDAAEYAVFDPVMYHLGEIISYPRLPGAKATKIERMVQKLHDEIQAEFGAGYEAYKLQKAPGPVSPPYDAGAGEAMEVDAGSVPAADTAPAPAAAPAPVSVASAPVPAAAPVSVADAGKAPAPAAVATWVDAPGCGGTCCKPKLAPASAPVSVAEAVVDRVPTLKEVFTITYKQFEHLEGLMPAHNTMKWSPREPLPIKFVEPGADHEKWLVERVDRLWEEELAGRQEGVPDLVVYGHFLKTPEFDGRAWIARVLHPKSGQYDVHAFFDKQWFSNFLGSGGVLMKFDGIHGVSDCILHVTGEHAFQTVKCLQVKTPEGIAAMDAIVLAKTPLDALRAAGPTKLPGLPKWWDQVTGGVMDVLVMNLIHNEDDFFNPMVKLARFCENVLNVNPATNLFIHEGNDNKIYGVDIAVGENPLKDRGVYVDGDYRWKMGGKLVYVDGYKWKGGDKLGQSLTKALRQIVEGYEYSFTKFDTLESEEGDVHQVQFIVLPPGEDEEKEEKKEKEPGAAMEDPAPTPAISAAVRTGSARVMSTARGDYPPVIGGGRSLSYVPREKDAGGN